MYFRMLSAVNKFSALRIKTCSGHVYIALSQWDDSKMMSKHILVWSIYLSDQMLSERTNQKLWHVTDFSRENMLWVFIWSVSVLHSKWVPKPCLQREIRKNIYTSNAHSNQSIRTHFSIKTYCGMVNLQIILNTKVFDKMTYANSADPDQTAPNKAVCSGSTLFAIPLSII